MSISNIAVVGSGEMGHGIAQVAAMNGYDVTMRDVEEDIVESGYEKIEWSLEKLDEKGELAQRPKAVLERIRTTTDLQEAVSDVDAVIEAVPEDIEIKQDVFSDLGEFAPDDAVLASNTSGIPISQIAEATDCPERVVGMHFFNPVVMMNLVEIIRGDQTSDRSVEVAEEISEGIDKEHVVVRKDVPGFITSRIISRFMIEAEYQLEETDATIEEIDAACKFEVGFPMGPFELGDQTGLDILLHGDNSFDIEPSDLHKELVEAGECGKKSGKGFYDYEDGSGCTASPDQADEYDALPIVAATVNEAARLVGWEVAPPDQIDLAMRLGTAYPKGPCRLGDEVGLDAVLEAIEDNPRWETSGYLRKLVEEGKTGESAGEGFYSYDDDTVTFETVEFDVDEGERVATLTLDRPIRQNALNMQMIEELGEAADLVNEHDLDEIRCLVLRGADGNFCAGGDITEIISWESHEPITRTDALKKLEELPIPTVAAIEGNCLGGGLEIASTCDFRIAAENATLGQPEIGLGLIPGGGGTQRLPRLVGLAKAKELVLLGDTLTASEAEEINLVTRVVALEEFEEAVEQFVSQLTQGPPVAQKLAKYVLHDAVESPIGSGLSAEQYAFSVLLETEDMERGLEASMNDERPDFRGN